MEPAQWQFTRARGGGYLTQDFDRSPFTVAWEITSAYAVTGDYLASDPSCPCVPAGFQAAEA